MKLIAFYSIFWHLLHVNLSKVCEGQLKTISLLPAFSISPGRSQHRHGHLHLQPRKFLWYDKISTPISNPRTKQGGVNNGLCWTQTSSQAFIVKSFNKKHHEIFYWSSTFLGSAPFGGVQILVHGLADSCLCNWNQKQDFLFLEQQELLPNWTPGTGTMGAKVGCQGPDCRRYHDCIGGKHTRFSRREERNCEKSSHNPTSKKGPFLVLEFSTVPQNSTLGWNGRSFGHGWETRTLAEGEEAKLPADSRSVNRPKFGTHVFLHPMNPESNSRPTRCQIATLLLWLWKYNFNAESVNHFDVSWHDMPAKSNHYMCKPFWTQNFPCIQKL